MASSIPSGLYFSPSLAISNDLKRPRTYKKPSFPIYPKSPVYNQPSRTAFAVDSSFRQYPFITFPPEITISPASSGSASFPCSLRIFNAIGLTGTPDEPNLCFKGVLELMTGEASDNP